MIQWRRQPKRLSSPFGIKWGERELSLQDVEQRLRDQIEREKMPVWHYNAIFEHELARQKAGIRPDEWDAMDNDSRGREVGLYRAPKIMEAWEALVSRPKLRPSGGSGKRRR